MNRVRLLGILTSLAFLAGCAPSLYHPERATRAYPMDLHRPQSVDVQVFRDDTSITLVNATPNTYEDVDLWINQRFVHSIGTLAAGETRTISLWDFYDVRGDQFNAGGLFRTREPTPVRLVEIQAGADQPLIGLIAIPGEPLE